MKSKKLLISIPVFLMAVLLVASMGLSSFATAALLGDADNDGMITTTDARWVLQAAVESRILTGTGLENADINGDGHITTTDARKTLNLALAPLEVSSIAVNTAPDKTTYVIGQSLNLTGAEILISYTNGSHEVVAVTSAMVSGYNASVAGEQTITVTYGSKTTSFTVTVVARAVTSIAMASAPAKTTYSSGEALDVIGASITVSYNDATSETVTVTSSMVSGYNASATGPQTLTVSYGGKTTTFAVTVQSSDPGVDAYGTGYNFNYLCGVDMFGRTFEPVQGFDDTKQVGMFYFLWNGQDGSTTGVYDISKLIAAGCQSDVLNTAGTSTSPLGQYHYWGKPMFGYYDAAEPWVIKRHVEMLTAAGVDFIVFDTTNALTYDNVWTVILDNLLSYQSKGWDVPKIAFYTNSSSTATMQSIYNSLYGNATNNAKYASLFYSPNGKPMIIGNDPPAVVSANMDVRPAYWPQQGVDGNYSTTDAAGFPWIEWVFPQYNHNGIISVSVAQHPNGRFSDNPIQGYGQANWGRGYANGSRNASSFRQGQNYQRQWDTAMSQNASTVFLTGWNEWIALKHIVNGRVAFVDCYNEEYSRDIEPMEGGYEDSFYLQTIQNIREYKGISGTLASGVSKTIDVSVVSTTTAPAQWNDVTNLYLNPQSTLYKRLGTTIAGTIPAEDADLYTTVYPVNNITSVKVTHDANNIYMLVNTSANVKNYTNTLVTNAVATNRWMNVFLGIGNLQSQGWNGYKYVVNRSATLATSSAGAVGTGSICLLNADGTTGTQVGTATISYRGKYVQIAIPRTAVGATSASGFYFKVADNVQNYLDINDYYITGKSFPMGRLSYYYYF